MSGPDKSSPLPKLARVRASEAERITRMSVVEQRAKRARGQLRALDPGEQGSFDVFDLAEMSLAQNFVRFRLNTDDMLQWMQKTAVAHIAYWAFVYSDEKRTGIKPSLARRFAASHSADWEETRTHLACWPGRLYRFFNGRKPSSAALVFKPMALPFNEGSFVVVPLHELGEHIARTFNGPLLLPEE